MYTNGTSESWVGKFIADRSLRDRVIITTKFSYSQRNWGIVAELDRVAKELNRSMAQVAIAWTANQPGIASTIIGATKRSQLEDNLKSFDFEIPIELMQRLDAVSHPESQFPYSYFESEIQGGLHGGTPISSKPVGYFPIDSVIPSAG